MLSRPTTEQILLDCCRELMTGVLPALTDETAVVRVVMIETVLRNMAVRSAHEIAWMTQETAEIEDYATSVHAAQSPTPSCRQRSTPCRAAPRNSLHLDEVVEALLPRRRGPVGGGRGCGRREQRRAGPPRRGDAQDPLRARDRGHGRVEPDRPLAAAMPVTLVTGAASGIGRAAVEQLLRAGGQVVAVDRPGASMDWLDRDDAEPVIGDVTDEATNTAAVDAAMRRFGGLDGLFLNAGMPVSGPLETLDLERFDECMNVNLRAVVLGLRAAASAMRARGGGAAVVTSSVTGLGGEPGRWPYAAAKAAVLNLVLVRGYRPRELRDPGQRRVPRPPNRAPA